MAQQPITNKTLNTADPTTVPKPTSVGGLLKVPIKEVKSSGAEPPAAIKVAPAISGVRLSVSEKTSRAGTKKSSQTTAIAIKV